MPTRQELWERSFVGRLGVGSRRVVSCDRRIVSYFPHHSGIQGGFIKIFGYRQISLVKPAPTANICTLKQGARMATLNLSRLCYPFTRTLPTTNFPLPIRKIKLMPALLRTSADITGSDRKVQLLAAGNRL